VLDLADASPVSPTLFGGKKRNALVVSLRNS
jgi:hypothetical protein